MEYSPGNIAMFTGKIEILSLRFFKMRLHYLTVCKNIPVWKYKKKILSILVRRQNIWHLQTISIFLMRIRWLVQLECKNNTDCHSRATTMKVSVNVVYINMENWNFEMELW